MSNYIHYNQRKAHTQRQISLKIFLRSFGGFDISSINNTELREMWIVSTLLSILADLILI